VLGVGCRVWSVGRRVQGEGYTNRVEDSNLAELHSVMRDDMHTTLLSVRNTNWGQGKGIPGAR
jgi:hypothetical protein